MLISTRLVHIQRIFPNAISIPYLCSPSIPVEISRFVSPGNTPPQLPIRIQALIICSVHRILDGGYHSFDSLDQVKNYVGVVFSVIVRPKMVEVFGSGYDVVEVGDELDSGSFFFFLFCFGWRVFPAFNCARAVRMVVLMPPTE